MDTSDDLFLFFRRLRTGGADKDRCLPLLIQYEKQKKLDKRTLHDTQLKPFKQTQMKTQ